MLNSVLSCSESGIKLKSKYSSTNILQFRKMDWSVDRNMKNFAFKCHRKKQNVYAVNSLKFHKQFGTFSSAGGDGTIYFWDKDQKQKLKEFKQMELSVTDVDFNYDGQLFAYAISYDWSKGIEHFKPKEQKPEIFIHKLELNEIKPKGGN